MSSYWVKTPKWLPPLFPKELIWEMPVGEEPLVYLTFDDGPHPEATVFALDALRQFNAKASFFCIGKNVGEQPGVYQRISDEGHTIGNHTSNHLNGWKTNNDTYLSDIYQAGKLISSRNFRPPYGRIRMSQVRRLSSGNFPWKIYMWTILSGDFDVALSPEECLKNVLDNLRPGAIVVFHDSAKALPRMKYTLPKVLEFCKEKNWQLAALPE